MPLYTEILRRSHVHRTPGDLDRRHLMDLGRRLPEPRTPTHEEIALMAYSFWEAGGRRDGTAMADWLRAEWILKQR
jgi:hypothetical protein